MPPLGENAQDVKSGKQCEQYSVEIAVAQLVERVSRMEQQCSSLIRLRAPDKLISYDNHNC